jgi:hypothetical protein
MVADGDTTTAEVTAVNVGAAERAVVLRCVGSIGCDACPTAPVGKSEFAPSECEALMTVGPGERWTTKHATTDVSSGAGATCLVVQEEGSVRGLTCVVDLNRPAYGFRERSYILVDGTISVPQPDGAIATYPRAWTLPP